jgi:hypothetical protein
MPITGGRAAPEAAMNRLVLIVFSGVALFALGWGAARGGRADAGVCALLTPEKLLEHPAIAEGYAEALRSGDADEIGRVEHALREIRSVHGCRGEFEMPSAPAGRPALPPGHPPVHHPSLDDRGMEKVPLFGAPGAVTI